jgi:CRISPR-associated protein Csb2
MATHFCLSVTLHDAAFHGCCDDGVPEWPPSPLRAFQALVAAAAARWRGPQFSTYAGPALEWLEGLAPPEILAPVGRTAASPDRLYVPNNAGDLVVKAWASGNTDASIAAHRTEKDVRPTRLVGGDAFTGGNIVRFVWRLPAEPSAEVGEYTALLAVAARSLTHLGWGIDMAAGHAGLLPEQEVLALHGDRRLERWMPATGGTQLRVPQPKTAQRPSTFHSLVGRHEEFTRRMTGGKPQGIPSLTAFALIGYRRATDPVSRPFVAFAILKPDASGNASFGTASQCCDVAAWVRNATGKICGDWPDVATFVHGHDPANSDRQLKGDGADDRFMYLPLPTINSKLNRVESIRRVLVAAPPQFAERVVWVRRRLPGQDLIDTDRGPVGMLNLLPTSDWVLRQYIHPARVWSTVTPVVLPGFDDGEAQKAERLLHRAFEQAGLSPELVRAASLEWRRVGFRAGVDLATRYHRPQPGRLPRYHVRVRWPVPIQGPLAVGAARYRGLGIFAAEGSA